MKRSLGAILLISSMVMAGDGTVDSSFGTGGISIQTPSILGIFVQSNGAIVACGGTVAGQSSGVPTVTRYSAQGILDTSFGTGGTVSFPSVNGFFNQILVQPDQKIVALGADRVNENFIATRLNPDGSLDSSFNGGSLLVITIAGSSVDSAGIVQGALQVDGSILLVGTVAQVTITSIASVTVRITPSGALDTTGFNSPLGYSVVQASSLTPTFGSSVAVQIDNKIVVRATTEPTLETNGNPVFIRYNTNGSLDATFGTGGILILATIPDFAAYIDFISFPKGLIIQSDGTMISSQYTLDTITNVTTSSLMKLHQDGSFDTSFGTGGIALLPTVSEEFAAPVLFQLLRQDNGSIIALGQVPTVVPSEYQSFITRFTSAGVLDTTFAAPLGYTVLIPSQFSVQGSIFSAGSFQQDGSVIAAGIEQVSPFQGYILKFVNSHPLVQTTLNRATLSGASQSVSVVELFANGVEVCSVLSLNDVWSCTGSVPANATLTAVAHYPGGNVDLLSICQITSPESALSTAIRAKYCPC